MARKLKTYITSAGFFDLAVAAPSMKAALEAWGSTRNLFRHGFARLSEDPEIVAATMARPGMVLRRPVGTDATFSEHAELPTNLAIGERRRPARTSRSQAGRPTATPADEEAARAAAAAFEREQRRRRKQEQREEAAAERLRQRRDEAIAAAEAALERAEKAHARKTGQFRKARAALDTKLEAEELRWKQQRDQLEADLRKARSGYLRLVR